MSQPGRALDHQGRGLKDINRVNTFSGPSARLTCVLDVSAVDSLSHIGHNVEKQ